MIFNFNVLLKLLNSKTLALKQFLQQLVVILVDFSIPATGMT